MKGGESVAFTVTGGEGFGVCVWRGGLSSALNVKIGFSELDPGYSCNHVI